MEEYLKRGRSDLTFQIVKELFCTRSLNGNALRSKMGKILITAEQKVNRWNEYLEELYAGQLSGNVLQEENHHILQSEIDFAIENLN